MSHKAASSDLEHLSIQDFFVALLTQAPRVSPRDFYSRGIEVHQMLARPAPKDFPALAPAARARLGLLAMLLFEPRAHTSWFALAARNTGKPLAFWSEESPSTPLNEAAHYWGFDRGVDPTMVRRAYRGDIL